MHEMSFLIVGTYKIYSINRNLAIENVSNESRIKPIIIKQIITKVWKLNSRKQFNDATTKSMKFFINESIQINCSNSQHFENFICFAMMVRNIRKGIRGFLNSRFLMSILFCTQLNKINDTPLVSLQIVWYTSNSWLSLENGLSWTSKTWRPSWQGIETDEGLTDQQGSELSP